MSNTIEIPKFYCTKCNTHIGCSYENFGNMCDEEINFEANKDKLIIYEIIEEINTNKNIWKIKFM